MKKIILAMLLALSTATWAEQCYFQTRRTGYDSGTTIKKISCETMKKIYQDIRFYDNQGNNYVRLYEQQIGKEGNLIVEGNGYTSIMIFYYALGEYRYYGYITYRGGNVVECTTTTSTGVCDNVEYTEFGNYFRDFLNSSARKKSRK